LEGRIARVMARRGFYVESNCFVPDPTESGKAIEVDVIGRYFEWVNEGNKDTVTASVLVECKNNSQPFAFFMQRQQVTEINGNRIHGGGFPSFSLDNSLTSIRAAPHFDPLSAVTVARSLCPSIGPGARSTHSVQ
jgi:hypothetical protein